jgi:membrane protein implicated in regulation of membrane protease activity
MEKSQYSIPYAGRFGAATNGVAVVVIGAFIAASEMYTYSIPLTLLFLAAVLLIWILMGAIIKRKAMERKSLLLGKEGKAVTDYKLNNNGIAYGKINVDGKQYRAYISRDARYDTDVLPKFIPGQNPNVSEAQRNLDTIAEMQENPYIVHKGVSLLVMDVDSMTPRVAMLRNS